ncbi:MAG: LLM class flavin-dependent oxidoreductase [Actinobacteria bacterium]|nr:LLM class flavin-dependent oxidoreductase [Actinomycetota bacterium]
MRIGYAIDLHAPAEATDEVRWDHVRQQAQLAEAVGFDLVLLPDHLYYAAGGAGDYARDDAAVGVWESVTVAAAIAASTTTIVVGHSMINAPYRPPALLANIATTLDEISGGRYQLGIGSGNSDDYDAVGVEADHRHDRFREAVEIVHGLLKRGHVDLDGRYWSARHAELVLRGPREHGPPLVLAAGGMRSMRLAAGYADAWNGFAAPDPGHAELRTLLDHLGTACSEVGRDPATLGRTVDTLVDPLDLERARERSSVALLSLASLGIEEARCYASTDGTHASRMDAIAGMADLVAAAHTVAGAPS